MNRDPFLDLLTSMKHRSFFLSAAAGNSGDLLLQKGLELYLIENNFSITTDIESAEVVLTHGGSNINDIWQTGISLFVANVKKYPNKTFVVAPHTFTFAETDFAKMLRGCRQDIYLFAREEKSFICLRSIQFDKNVSTYLSHDTAFLLEGTEYLKKLQADCSDSYVLQAMRTDRESLIVTFDLDRIPQNFFEKLQFTLGQFEIRKYLAARSHKQNKSKPVISQDVSYLLYDGFIKQVQGAAEIHTDRLHVGILGALLRKQVFLYPTKYNKVSGVYGQSLHAYPHVTPQFD